MSTVLPSFEIVWNKREHPLPVRGIVAVDSTMAEVLRRIKRQVSDEILKVVVTTRALIFLDHLERIPWVDGLIYVGGATNEPRLMMPCMLATSFPESSVYAAVTKDSPQSTLVVLPEQQLVIDLSNPRYFTVSSLHEILHLRLDPGK